MTDHEEQAKEESEGTQEKPVCTTATTAEHSRLGNEDGTL